MKVFENLRSFNLVAAVLHLLQAGLMLSLSTDFRLPVTTAFVGYDPQAGKLEPMLRTAFELPVGPMVAGFLFLSAVAHFAVSAPGVYDWYQKNISRGINYARWMEYALSSSLMIVVIALLVGIYDLVSLLLIFFLNAMMILFGWMMELHNQTTERVNWTSFLFGSLAGAAAWVAIAIYLAGAGNEFGNVPTFVYWIFFSIFIFFNLFAINMILQYKKLGPWRRYLFGERMYIVLSLVAKSLLAWQVWAGTLRPL
jgi:hypothetical protein